MALAAKYQNIEVFDSLKKVINDLGEELHWPKSRTRALSESTMLDKELGLDSLTRVELASRVERQFGVVLGEKIFLKIETIGDLVDVIVSAPSYENMSTLDRVADDNRFALRAQNMAPPIESKTLLDVLKYYRSNSPSRPHIIIVRLSGEPKIITYDELYSRALRIASNLIKRGVVRGERVAIMLPTSEEYFYSFVGVIMCGGVPVPIYPPIRLTQLRDHIDRHAGILKNANARLILCDRSVFDHLGDMFRFSNKNVEMVDVATEMITESSSDLTASVVENDCAFIQYTSGSTGNPKGVVLTHANILANIRAMGDVLQASSQDVFVSWLPLYHDMGLIGAWLGSMYFGCLLVVMSPFSFLSSPGVWLETIHRFQATITAAPNFAFELCLKHITQESAEKLNLSSLRAICNGAEPVSAKTVLMFNEFFSRSKLNPKAMMPVYGLAENSVGLAFPQLLRGARIDSVSRNSLERRGIAKKSASLQEQIIDFVSCGRPLPGHEIRIVDASGNEVAERHEGRIQFRGPSATLGYLNQDSATKDLFCKGWLDSGDLGYLAEGELYVTGRNKDLIKHAGRNIHPEELEMLLGEIPGVRKGCVVVFGAFDPNAGTEKLVIVAETREHSAHQLNELSSRINALMSDIFGPSPASIKLVKPHTLLKTSSGKLRRSACRILFEKGELERHDSRLRYSFLGLYLANIFNRMRQGIEGPVAVVKSSIVWTMIGITTLILWPFIVLPPSLKARWFAARVAAKLALSAAGVKLQVYGVQKSEPTIYVANHASYSDVIYLLSALPHPVAFVAKSELKKSIPIKITLDRLGVIYVERFDREASLSDAELTTRVAKTGKSLLSFPEGTFTRVPGLLPFHLGPFLTAVEAGLVLVPIAINGARSILHPDSWIIRSGTVSVHLLPPVKYEGLMETRDELWKSALKLLAESRQSILGKCGEPDQLVH